MKTQILLGFCALILFSFPVFSQNVTLNFDAGLINSTTPAAGRTIAFDVEEKRSSCVQLYGSNAGSVAQVLDLGQTSMATGQRADILAIARLQRVTGSSDGRRYVFGRTCAERFKADANVRVVYGSFSADAATSVASVGFEINLPPSDVLTVSNNNTNAGPTGDKDILLVQASNSNRARISINQDNNRGQCLIALITPGSDGSTIAILDPKAGPTSYYTGQSVYVIPVIRPTIDRSGADKLLNYDVGDPRRNAKVTVKEL